MVIRQFDWQNVRAHEDEEGEPVSTRRSARRTPSGRQDAIMKLLLLAVISLCFVSGVLAQKSGKEKQVRQAVQSFYDAFNAHNFDRAAEFTTEDWVHINPLGGWTRGREAVLNELKEVHSTFLKGVSDTPEEMAISFAAPDVAIVTVPGRVSTYTTPDGVRHENERQIRTFLVVKRGPRWLIMHDQNTIRSR